MGVDVKGTSSIEYLFVTGLALAALSVIIVLSMNIWNDSMRVAQAKNSVETLAKSADYVSSLGAGSKETVSVSLPAGISLMEVRNSTVHMRISLSSGESDVYAKSKSRLIGSLPLVAGEQKVAITALSDGSVLFGKSLLLCEPGRITIDIPYTGSNSTAIVVTNIAPYAVTNLTAVVGGNLRDISAWTAMALADLAPGNNTTASFAFSPAGSVGVYSGAVEVVGSNWSRCISQIVVNAYNDSAVSNDNIPPEVRILECAGGSLKVGADDTGRGDSFISNCQYQIDGGGWKGMYLPPYSSVNITAIGVDGVPYDNATHSISASCTDDANNAGSNTSSIMCRGMGVPLPGITNDTYGPIILFMNHSFVTFENITINGLATDFYTGGNNISGCYISVDSGNGPWNAANASDGSFNSPTESFTYKLSLSINTHTIYARCNDSLGNMGGIFNDTIPVSKTDVMIVMDRTTKVNAPSGEAVLAAAKSAAKTFVDMTNSEIQVGLVEYDAGTQPKLDQTMLAMTDENKAFLKDKIDNISADNGNKGTAMDYAITKGSAELASSRSRYPSATRAMLLFNYGTGSLGAGSELPIIYAASGARNNDTKIYTIGFGTNLDSTNLLTNIAYITNGRYHYAPNNATMSCIFQHIGEALPPC